MPFKVDELFYELDARTAGFEGKIGHAQRSVDDFAKFIRGKPMLATAAFGAAIVAIGVEAIKMANDVDVALRRVTAAFPQAGKEVERLRNLVSDLSSITPRSQTELAEAAAKIAERGAESVAELQLRLRRAVELADATGTDLIAVIDGLDNVGDAFGITASKAADALTQIFGAAQGKVSLDEVFATLEKGGSVLASLGVTATAAGEAMVALIDAGIPRRQAGTVLTTILELTSRVKSLKAAGGEQAEVGRLIEATLSRQNVATKGLTGALGDFAAGVQRGNRDLSEYGIRSNVINAIQRVVAASIKDTRTEAEKLADAQARLTAAAATNNESASALAKILKNELADSLIRLGNDLLPTAIKLIDGLTSAFRRLHGEGNPLRDLQTLGGKLPTAAALGRNNLRRGTRFQTAEEGQAGEFRDAFNQTAERAGRLGADAFSGISEAKLQEIKKNIAAYQQTRGTLNDAAVRSTVALNIALNQAILTARQLTETPAGDKKDPPKVRVDELTKQVRDAIRTLERGVESAIVGETDTKIDDARLRVSVFGDEVAKLEKESGKRLDKLRAEGARLQGAVGTVETKERTEAARKVADEVAQALGLQSRVMEQGLKDFLADVDKRNAEYAKLGLAPLFSGTEIDNVRQVRQALIDTTRAAEETDAAITKSKAASDPAFGGRRNLLAASGIISDRLTAVDAERSATSPDTPAGMEKRKRLLGEIVKLQAELNALRAQNDAGLDKQRTADEQHLRALQDQATAINTAVGLALQLGDAFGLVSANAAKLLTGISGAVSGFGAFKETLSQYKSGATKSDGSPLASLGSVIGAASPIIGGITAVASIVGGFLKTSPEELERRRLLAENNRQLANLSKNVGDLARINVKGTDVDTFRKLLADPRLAGAIGLQGTNSDNSNRVIGDVLRSMGLTAEELKDFAKQFGLTVGATNGDRFTFDDIVQLTDALKKSELTQFAQDFTGGLQQMDAEINLFDIKDPIAQLKLFRKAIDGIKGGGGVLQQTIDAFDTSTAEGLAAAQTAIQSLFTQLQSGSLDASQFGGLTGQQFLDALEKAGALLKTAIAGGGGTPGTGGFNVSQQITEVTGARLGAIAATSQIFLNQISDNTALIARLLGGNPSLPAIVPPTVAVATQAQGAITIGDIVINVSAAGLDNGSADALGGRMGGAFVQELDRQLGSTVLWRARGRGTIAR